MADGDQERLWYRYSLCRCRKGAHDRATEASLQFHFSEGASRYVTTKYRLAGLGAPGDGFTTPVLSVSKLFDLTGRGPGFGGGTGIGAGHGAGAGRGRRRSRWRTATCGCSRPKCRITGLAGAAIPSPAMFATHADPSAMFAEWVTSSAIRFSRQGSGGGSLGKRREISLDDTNRTAETWSTAGSAAARKRRTHAGMARQHCNITGPCAGVPRWAEATSVYSMAMGAWCR